MKRKKVAVFFGGRSGEHVVSLRSAASIMEAIDPDLYEVIAVGISREGKWFCGPDAWLSLWEQRIPSEAYPAVMLTDPSRPGLLVQSARSPEKWQYMALDLAFPVLHGPYGEDGTIQGLFEMAGIPYVGSGVLASSTAMDKVVMKSLFEKIGLPITPYQFFFHWQWKEEQKNKLQKVESKLGFPCFVKPANLGSSVGVARVRDAEDLIEAVNHAFLYDEKVIVEKYVEGREIECSVLGDIEAEASVPGEVVPCNEFYDYRAKYIDERSEIIIPADLSEAMVKKVQELSLSAFQAVEAGGLARVDFFVNPTKDTVIVNEINTMPGFTSISMYPKMWEASGVSYRELVGRLLELAVKRAKRRRQLLMVPPE
jgi:D-alanine-D-alanine ligase